MIPAFNGSQQAWVDALPQYDLQVYIDALDTAVPYPVSKNTAAWTALESEILSQVWAGSGLARRRSEAARRRDAGSTRRGVGVDT